MSKILIVDRDEQICDVLAESFETNLGAEVECAQTGTLGAHLITKSEFDLAVIEAMLPGFSGIELAAFATNENLPVLLTSGNPMALLKLNAFGYPHVSKPYSLAKIYSEADKILRDVSDNIQRMRAAAVRMKVNLEALEATMAESRRLTQQSKALLHQRRKQN